MIECSNEWWNFLIDNTKSWWKATRARPYVPGQSIKIQLLLRTVRKFLIKLNICLFYDQVILFLDIYQEKWIMKPEMNNEIIMNLDRSDVSNSLHPMDYGLPVSFVHWIFQQEYWWLPFHSLRIIFSTQGSNPHLFSYSLSLAPPGSPVNNIST